MSNQSGKQAAIRLLTGTASTYEGDWHALFDLLSIPAGPYNDRLLAFINIAGGAYTDLPSAMAAYAESLGFYNWDSLNTVITPSPPTSFSYSATSLAAPTGFTFTRASTGTYLDSDGLLKSAAIDTARFDYKSPYRNLLMLPETFATPVSVWTPSNATVTDNTSVAPDGTTTAATLTENTANLAHILQYGNFPYLSGRTYTFSSYVKANGRTRVFLQLQTPTVAGASSTEFFDLSTGAHYGSGVGSVSFNPRIENVGSGWFRVSMQFTSIASVSGTVAVGTASPVGITGVYEGDGVSGILVWGVQLEYGSLGPYYPVTAGVPAPVLQGLLLEESRVNFARINQDFSDAYWTKTNATVTADSGVAPDGATTADLIVPNASVANNHLVSRAISFTSGLTYTLSVFIKSSGYDYALLAFGAGAFPGFTSILVSARGGWKANGPPTNILNFDQVMYPNGWSRVSFTVAATATASAGTEVRVFPSAVPTAYAGNLTSGMEMWGYQVEVGTSMTSYIPNASAAADVTRSADSLSGATSGLTWFDAAQGTFVNEWDVPYDWTSGSSARLLECDDGTSNNRFSHLLNSSDTTGFAVTASAASVASMTGGARGSVTAVKDACRYATDNYAFRPINLTGAVTTDSAGTMPTGLTTLRLGSFRTNTLQPNGYLKSFRYWDTPLTNAQMQGLS